MHRLGIWLIALTLVFSGAMAAVEIDPSEGPLAMMDGQSAASGVAAGEDHADTSAGGARSDEHRHGARDHHLKCCARCAMVSLLPGAMAMPAAPAFAKAEFHTAQHDLVGRLVAIDPRIPKPIV